MAPPERTSPPASAWGGLRPSNRSSGMPLYELLEPATIQPSWLWAPTMHLLTPSSRAYPRDTSRSADEHEVTSAPHGMASGWIGGLAGRVYSLYSPRHSVCDGVDPTRPCSIARMAAAARFDTPSFV